MHAAIVMAGTCLRHPAQNVGELIARFESASAKEVRTIDAWSISEAGTLLRIARETEPALFQLLLVLAHTGMRRGEAQGLIRSDIDLEGMRVRVARAWSHGSVTVPKSGRAQWVSMRSECAATLDCWSRDARGITRLLGVTFFIGP